MTTEFTHELPLGTTLTAHEHIGFELGWDYAHHGLNPPAPYDQEPSSLRHGLLAGQAAFGDVGALGLVDDGLADQLRGQQAKAHAAAADARAG